MSLLELEVSETARQKVAGMYPGMSANLAKAVGEAFTILEGIDERYSGKGLSLGDPGSYSDTATTISLRQRIPTPEEINQARSDYMAEREPIIRVVATLTAGYMPPMYFSAGRFTTVRPHPG